MDCSLSGSSVHGIFQARVLEWIAISFSRGSSRPRNPTQVSRIAGRRFTIWATRESMVFPVVMYGCGSWTLKKAECRRIDVLELWCWRRLLRVPWTARRSNLSILKEIGIGKHLKLTLRMLVLKDCSSLCLGACSEFQVSSLNTLFGAADCPSCVIFLYIASLDASIYSPVSCLSSLSTL